MPEIIFALAKGQNAFFVELATVLADELRRLGHRARIETAPVPDPGNDAVYVLLPPHEYFGLTHGAYTFDPARTIFVCAEPPGSPWFEGNLRLAPYAGAIFDINLAAVEAFAESGLEVTHLPLGYSPAWDRFDPDAERDLDVVFLGCATEHRGELLASYAPILSRYRCELVISDNDRPNSRTSPAFVAGEDKWALLGRSKLLLNVHRSTEPAYFEWVRVLEAIHCGAVVVSERSTHFDPLVAGEHFVSGRGENLGLLCELLLSDEDERRRLQTTALEHIRKRLPLRDSARKLAEAAARIDSPLGHIGPHSVPRPFPPEPPIREVLGSLLSRTRRRRAESARERKRERLDEIAALRARAAAERIAEGVDPHSTEAVTVTSSYEASSPRVSVIVPVYGYEHHVLAALDSVFASDFDERELIVVDDGSTDDAQARVAEWLSAHQELPAKLVAHAVNRGLPSARNTAIAESRGELILPLDSDNELLPSGLGRLTAALDASPDAAFAYGLLECFDERGPAGIVGWHGWEPERLADDNYIDALALIRRSALEAVGGYVADEILHGWEDYDLWCTMADRGLHGHHVREFVARYRLRQNSMIQFTGTSTDDARARMAERHPQIFAGAH